MSCVMVIDGRCKEALKGVLRGEGRTFEGNMENCKEFFEIFFEMKLEGNFE